MAVTQENVSSSRAGIFHQSGLLDSKKVTCFLLVLSFVCCWSMAHACGEDPMTNIKNIAQAKGLSVQSVLRYLQNNNPEKHLELMQLYRRYLECMGHIDTGYFRKKRAERLPGSIINKVDAY